MRFVLFGLPPAGALLGALVAVWLDPSFALVGASEGFFLGGAGALMLWMKSRGVPALWLAVLAALIAIAGPLLGLMFPVRGLHDGGMAGLFLWTAAGVGLGALMAVVALGYRALDVVTPSARTAIVAVVSLAVAIALPWLDVGRRMEERQEHARSLKRAELLEQREWFRSQQRELQREAEARTRRMEERARRRIPGRPVPQPEPVDCARRPTPLIAAVEARDPVAVRRLLRGGTNPDQGCDFGEGTSSYPLSVALALGETEIARVLLEAGAHPDLTGPGAPLPLASAIERGNLDLARELIARGADVDAQSNGTPLVMLAAATSLRALEVLLEAGANPEVSVDGRTPLTVAISSGHQEIAERLRAEGARQ